MAFGRFVDGTAGSRRVRVAVSILFAVAVAGGLGLALHRRLLCAGIFLRLEHARAPAWIVHYRERAVVESAFAFAGGKGVLYAPEGERPAQGIVLAHGMHELGIRDPRMLSFARALAGAGFAVLTPEVVGLAHYRLVHTDVTVIGESARALARRIGRERVIVFGISLAGGLALRAACEPATRAVIERVIGLGAHHDAVRVARFFLGEPAYGPAGEHADVKPHPYGPSSLWITLFGEKHPGKGKLTEEERLRALRAVTEHTPDLERASPSACPEPVRVPVYLVHGTGDRIVPYTETLWNGQELARHTEVQTLISPAIVHAEYEPPTWRQRVELVEFIVDALF